MWVQSLGREDPLENEIATHPIILAQKSHDVREQGIVQIPGGRVSQAEKTEPLKTLN